MNYTEINSKTIDRWVDEGWKWGKPIDHETYENAKNGVWDVGLTPTKPVPHEWFGELSGKKLLGLASGGGQLKAGFTLTDIFGDTNGYGRLQELNIESYIATRTVKK